MMNALMILLSTQVALTPCSTQTRTYSPCHVQWTPARNEANWSVPLVHSTVLLVSMRVAESYLYASHFAETNLRWWSYAYKEAFSKPPKFDIQQKPFQWDGDPWPINIIGHGLFGSEVYMRARTCGASSSEAFFFTAGVSAVWEYVVEANGVRPSVQDLIYTPLMGLALGEARFQLWRLANNIKISWVKTAIKIALDPFGELERRLRMTSC